MNITKLAISKKMFGGGGGDSSAAYNRGIADGKRAEYNDFWDNYQENGNRKNYSNAFRVCWVNAIFKPKYDIKGNGAFNSAFAATSLDGDLVELLNLAGVSLDTSQATSLNSCFYGATKITRIGTIDTRGTNDIDYLFDSASSLKTVEKLILKSDGSQNMNLFNRANALKNIVIEGTIGSSINLQWSPLSPESIKSIISCLKNYAGTSEAYSYKLTLSVECWAALEADSSAPDGGTWADYVDSLGWNC